MVANDDGTTEPTDASCTTTTSFAAHDIEDGSVLIQRAYYRLSEAESPEYEPSEAFFDRVESAFIWAYLGSNEERGVPAHVEAALDDARVLTEQEFAENPDADLRTDVLPAFYRRFADFHCAYRD